MYENRIISINETGINFHSINNYGWSKSKKKCIINHSHKNVNIKFSLLSAISRNKIVIILLNLDLLRVMILMHL